VSTSSLECGLCALQLHEELTAADARRHHHHHHHHAPYVGISTSSGSSSGSGGLGASHQTAAAAAAHLTLAAAPAPHAAVMLQDHHVVHPVINHPSIHAELAVRFTVPAASL